MNEQTPISAAETTFPEAIPVPAAPPYPQVTPLKKQWDLNLKDRIFAWIMLPFGFLFARYVLLRADGFVTTAFFWLLFACTEIYLRKSGCKPKLPHRILGIIFCLFSTVFSITASPLLHGLCFIFLAAVLIWRTHAAAAGAGFVTRFMPFDLAESAFRFTICYSR